MSIKRFLWKILIPFACAHNKISISWDKLRGDALLKSVPNKGVGCRFEGFGILHERHRLVLGDYVSIGRNAFMRCAGEIRIGSYTHISRNVTIHTVNHNIDGELLPYDRSEHVSPVTVGRYVWIGMNVNILPGVCIGDGAVIGMGTTVSKNVPDGAIVAGHGCRQIGSRNSEVTARLEKEGRFLTK